MGKVEKISISGINLYLERVQTVTARTEKCTKNGFMVTNETNWNPGNYIKSGNTKRMSA